MKPAYFVMVHDSFEDVLDDMSEHPSILIKPQDSIWMKISKTVVDAIPTETRVCVGQDQFGPVKCRARQIDHIFMDKYGCTLPWMKMYSNLSLCQIGQHPVQSYTNLASEWECYYTG
jgi:hypothetical protein